jgi:hypothetical protein
LRAAPDGALRVVHPGRHAVYLDLGGWCLGVVGSLAAAVPCALRTSAPELASGSPASAHVRDGVHHLDGTPVRVGRIVDARTPRLDLVTTLRGTAGSAAVQTTPPAPVVEHIAPVWGSAPLDPATVARLVGRGDGLTPLGDDVLCGWLALHRSVGVPTPEVDAAVRSLLPRTTLLSATLLDCALHGEVLPEFAAYLLSLGTSDEPSRAADLSSVGHTSGAGLLHGARRALAELAPRTAQDPPTLTRGAA